MDTNDRQDTTAWSAQVWISFFVSFGMTGIGIAILPVDLWVRGYMAMGLLFTIGSCFQLAKHVRDAHEQRRLHNRVHKAKTEKILHEFERAAG